MLSTTVLYILIGAAVTLVALLIALLVLQLRNSARINKLTYPAYEYTMKRAQEEAQQVVIDAKARTRKLMVEAEMEGIKLVAREKVAAHAASDSYREALDALAEELRGRLEEEVEQALSRQRALAEDIESRVAEGSSAINGAAERIEGRLSELAGSVEGRAQKMEAALERSAEQAAGELRETLAALERESRERLRTHLDEAFESAQGEIDAYRRKRMELLDRQIVGLVEETASIALQRELSVGEHADLVKEALKEAKAQGVFSSS